MTRDRPLLRKVLANAIRVYNAAIRTRVRVETAASDLREEEEILDYMSRNDTAISDNLQLIFWASLAVAPRSIVELGVRGGDSTFVFERVADLTGAYILSSDIVDCSGTSHHERRYFVREDDVVLASRFGQFCRANALYDKVDILFVDTSHTYDHTCREIEAWFPHLGGHCVAIFHDTNLKVVNRRVSGRLALGWNNERGVIRALEAYLGTALDETSDFLVYRKGWLVSHHAASSGLTILSRVPALQSEP